MTDNKSSNDITLTSYEEAVLQYVEGTPKEVSGPQKLWIDKTLQLLSSDARIFEIGSGFGRDAAYIESFGFSVERTDATDGFVHLLKELGHSAKRFNVLLDPFLSNYDLIFANAVFLHFTPQELKQVLHKIYASLVKDGLLAFSVKHGEGEEWTNSKIGKLRYFCYWNIEKLNALLASLGFIVIWTAEDEKFLQLIVKK